MKLFLVVFRRHASLMFFNVCMCVFRSNMHIRDTLCRMYVHDDFAYYLRMQSRPGRLVLFSWISVHVDAALCMAHAHIRTLACTHEHQMQVNGSGYLSSLLLQQMPVATRPGRCCHVFGFSAPRTSVSAAFAHVPPSRRPAVTHRSVFRPFCHVIGHWPYPRRSSGVESTRRSDDEATASFPSHFFLLLSLFFSLSLARLFFSLRKTILSNQRSDNNRDLGINGTNRWLIDCVVYARTAFTVLCPRFDRR